LILRSLLMRAAAFPISNTIGRSRGRDVTQRAALGVRCHSGWAAYVVLGGSNNAPDILARGRMELCDPSIKGSKQPFHEAEPMPFEAGKGHIDRCRKSSDAFAARAAKKIMEAHPDVSACCVLDSSGRKLPELRAILASHALIHSAEGEFYRDIVARASEEAGVPVMRVRERDLESAADALPGTATGRKQRLADFGKQVGTPWRQDEKFAALAAWLALASRPVAKVRSSRVG
jgi:hypothetical protein